ncbi:MAG: SUMF1/EgtB/PvdO family nonheme iron enzyme [Opitutales bacterium]|nr:SUMF1/EgtB/PvdO family nonheme iron enzyme [Opitutales bacterium]
MDEEVTRLPPEGADGGASLLAGQDFDEYRVIRLLGRGGMGEVYEVEHRELHTRHALKLINREIVARADSGDRFRREARVMAQLRHPHIVHVDDFRQSHGRAWLRMELIEGGSLGEKLKAEKGKLKEGEAREILRQVLEGLAYAHKEGVVHRDLKPGNVLLEQGAGGRGQGPEVGGQRSEVSHQPSEISDRNSASFQRSSAVEKSLPPIRAKIADFGLVKLAGEQWIHSQVQKSVARSMSMSDRETALPGAEGDGSVSGGTSTKALLGTYAYMSPEQKRGEEADASSDVYAVGLMAYQMLTGAEGLGMQLPSRLNPEIDPAWDDWISQATMPNPSDRFADAGSMLAALPERRQVGSGVSSRSAAKARGSFRWVIAAVLLLAVGAGAWWVGEQRGALDAEPPVGVPPLGGPVAEQRVDTPLKSGTPTETAALASQDGAPPSPSVILRIDPAEAGARVWLGAESDVPVGADGVVRFADFPLGEHELLVQAPGYQPVVTRVEVGPSGLDERIRLVPVRGAVEVLTSAGALVVAVDGSGVETRLGEADANGRLLSENVLRIGEYRLRLSAERRESAEVPVELMIGRTVRVERALEPLPGELRVLSVPTGASVAVEGGGWRATGETPATLRGVPAERELSVAVSLRGYRTERRSVTLDPAEVRTLNVGTLVAEAGALEVRMQNEELRSGAGVGVKVDGREQTGSWRNGVLRVEGLEVGRRSVEVSHPSYRSDTSDLPIQDQRATAHEVRLEPLPGRLTLTVSGPSAGDWSVEVNGEAVRPASGNVLELPAQREQLVRVSARGWQASEQRVTLGAAERRTLTFRLEEARGPVPGQNAEVELPGGVKLDLVWIRPGEFTMSSPNNESGRFDNEGPQTRVRLTKGFWLGKYPVTQGQWQALMGNNPSHFKNSGLNAPVESVSWNDVMEFARKLTEQERRAGRLPEGYVYTLPSEAQWEYAARAGTTTRFYTGNSDSDLDRAGWFSGNAGGSTKPVGQKVPNAWGLYDMHGNVWEWTRTWFGNYPGGSFVDYEGPNSGSNRVLRGGSWNRNAQYCRSASRGSLTPTFPHLHLGFRLALSSVP